MRERGHVQGREVVQSGKPNKLVYSLTTEGAHALKQWSVRPSVPALMKDDLLVRFYALDSIDLDALRTDLMARLEYHRDRLARYERILKKRFPQGSTSPAETGRLLLLRMGLRHERAVAEWCEDALQTLSGMPSAVNVTPIVKRELSG